MSKPSARASVFWRTPDEILLCMFAPAHAQLHMHIRTLLCLSCTPGIRLFLLSGAGGSIDQIMSVFELRVRFDVFVFSVSLGAVSGIQEEFFFGGVLSGAF